MSHKIVIHLSTKDVQKARAFYTALGFTPNEQFSGDTCADIVISDTIQIMLSSESVFSKFSPRAVCDTSKFLEVLNCLSCSSRAEVDTISRHYHSEGRGGRGINFRRSGGSWNHVSA
jgi:uncharacterized protein